MRLYIDPNEKKSKLSKLMTAAIVNSVASDLMKTDEAFERTYKAPNPYFEFLFCFFLELIALFDMFGDIYLLV